MTLNFPASYECKISYQVTPVGFATMTHVFSFNLPEADSSPSVGGEFEDFTFPTRSGVPNDLDTVTNAVIAAMDNFYSAATRYIKAELFYYDASSYEAQWQAVLELDQVGAAATASTPAHQITFTAKTSEGGIARWQFMEDNQTGKNKMAFPTGNASYDAVKNLMINPAMPFVGQDGGWLVAGNFASLTFNEKLEKKRYRA